ncbi:hypothetical protein [Ruminococcus sp.]|uniref:hypothetical protein n=1 Tax=Ruminococcus sp. TaxID=41978 RepID=UPI00386590DC
MKDVIEEKASKNNESFEKLMGIVFSSAMSLFISYLSKSYIDAAINSNSNDIWTAIELFALSIVVFIISFILIRWVYYRIETLIKKVKNNLASYGPDLSEKGIKELIDDFDHIVYDNLIICYEFENQINNSSSEKLTNFYFHEIIYYLRKAVDITIDLTDDDRFDKCLNINKNVHGVDIFRLNNAFEMMDELYEMIISHKNNITKQYDERLKRIIDFQIVELKKDIGTINKKCEKAINMLTE